MLDDLLDYLEQARRYDRYIASLCPFHDDSKPSFFVYEDYYICKSCGEQGQTQSLQSKLGVDTGVYVPAKKQKFWRNPFNDWIKRFGSLPQAMKAGYQFLKEYDVFRQYLYDRGLTDETINSLYLGYLDQHITVPIFENKIFVGATARATDNSVAVRYCVPNKQNPSLLYSPNWKLIQDSNFVILVFGIFDAIILSQSNVPVITTTRGIYSSGNPFEDIRKQIFVIPDAGEEKTASRLVQSLGWRGKLLTIPWSGKNKDINDIYLNDKQLYLEVINGLERSI